MKSGANIFFTDRAPTQPSSRFQRLIYQTLQGHTPGGVIGLNRSASLPFFSSNFLAVPRHDMSGDLSDLRSVQAQCVFGYPALISGWSGITATLLGNSACRC